MSGKGKKSVDEADTQSLNVQLDFEEQVRKAEIKLKDDRRPLAGHNSNVDVTAEEEDQKRKLNEESLLFNSKYRLTALATAGTSGKRGPASAFPLTRRNPQWIQDGTSNSFSERTRELSPGESNNDLKPKKPTMGRGRGILDVRSEPEGAPGTFISEDIAVKVIEDVPESKLKSSSSLKPSSTNQNIRVDDDEELSDSDKSSVQSSCGKEDGKQRMVKLLEKPEGRVAYGCISIGDVPGRTLVRGSMLMTPLANITKFIYHDIMKGSLSNCGLEEINVLQKSVAPHFLRGDDCFIIGGPGCGKSLSYLIPLVGSLVWEFYRNNPQKGLASSLHTEGPHCIIVCDDYKSAIKVEGHLHNLVANRLVVAVVCDNLRETRAKCEVPLDIMITTLTFAVDMIKRCHSHFKFDRLRYMVFDGVDVMMRSFPDEVETVRVAAENFVIRNPRRRPYQRVFCGHEWNGEMEKLYFKLPGLPDPNVPVLPTVHIQSRNQAIRYSNMKWKMYHVDEEDKINKLIGLLRSSVETARHKNIFIVCNSPEVAYEVHTELDKEGITTELADMDTMSTADVVLLTKRWESTADVRSIMVLHDAILRSLMIYNVTCLIHYDLPLKVPNIKSSAGADRFSCMWGYFRDISEEKESRSLKYQRQELEAHFLLTGKENELYKLKVFAMKMGTEMPESLSIVAEEMGMLELEKKLICPGIKLYGKCMESVPEYCTFRHTFRLEDLNATPTIPRSGEIEVKITNCVNPSSYIGQVIRYYELKDRQKILKNNLINSFNDRTKKLDAYYAIEGNRVPPESFEIGTLCGVKVSMIGYARAKIEKVMTRTAMNFPKTIKIFCIDHGEFLQPLADDLFALPEGFDELPQLAVNIVLANLLPLDNASDYRLNHIKTARTLTLDKILHGKIALSIGDTVWLNPLVEMHKDPRTQKTVKGNSIRLELIRERKADNNDYHIEDLKQICKSVNFNCPEFLEQEQHLSTDKSYMSQFINLGDEIRWAFVPVRPIENPESVKILTSFTKDPYNIFGANDKFTDQLFDLNSEIDQDVKDMIAESCSNYDTEFESYYEIGLVVAVKDQVEAAWMRGMIMNAYVENGVCFFDIFLVDVGEQQLRTTMKDMFPMRYGFVKRLPFQAIGFELAHIRPKDSTSGVWDEATIDKVINLTVDEDGNATCLEVVALESKKHPVFGCRYYRAMMYLDSGKELGEVMVDNGGATFSGTRLETIKQLQTKLLAKYNQMYDNRNEASEDEDSDTEIDRSFEDSEDADKWDVQGFDTEGLKKALGVVDSVKNKVVMKPGPSNSSKENLAPLPQVGNGAPGTSTSLKSGSNEAKEAPLPLFSDLLHPKVYWRQTKNQLILVVNHPDVQKYTLEIDGQQVSFRTVEPPGYGFDINFFGRLDSKADVFLTGQYLRIKMNKRMQWKWPKPMKEDIKFPWFKEDPDSVHSSDEEEDITPEKMFSPVPVNFDNNEKSEDSDSDDEYDPEETDAITTVEM